MTALPAVSENRTLNLPVLQTQRLTIGYRLGRQPARILLSQIDLSLAAGEVVCLIGPNGVGKSTLLRTLAGTQNPLDGRVLIGGADIHRLPKQELARRLGIVLTERVQPGLMTGRDLVALGRYPYTGWSGSLTEADRQIVERAIQSVSGEALADRYISDLSDGERQKIMIARALAQEPEIILLDEPTAFLDLPRRVEILHLLRRLAHEQDGSFIVSTHDLELALRVADRLWLMPGDGRLIEGSPEDLSMNGELERAFSSHDIAFDAEQGAFRVIQSPKGEITLAVPDHPRYQWTRRALERVGYDISQETNTAALEVEIIDSPLPGWRLYDRRKDSERVSMFSTLYELTRALRRPF